MFQRRRLLVVDWFLHFDLQDHHRQRQRLHLHRSDCCWCQCRRWVDPPRARRPRLQPLRRWMRHHEDFRLPRPAQMVRERLEAVMPSLGDGWIVVFQFWLWVQE